LDGAKDTEVVLKMLQDRSPEFQISTESGIDQIELMG
jgi:hypothetical protein